MNLMLHLSRFLGIYILWILVDLFVLYEWHETKHLKDPEVLALQSFPDNILFNNLGDFIKKKNWIFFL